MTAAGVAAGAAGTVAGATAASGFGACDAVLRGGLGARLLDAGGVATCFAGLDALTAGSALVGTLLGSTTGADADSTTSAVCSA